MVIFIVGITIILLQEKANVNFKKKDVKINTFVTSQCLLKTLKY